MVTIGRSHAPFDDIHEIAVLRGGGLGDLLFAMPAIDALAAKYPEARLTLLGSPLAAALLDGRPGPISRVEVLPIAPGVRDGVPREGDETREQFLGRLRGQFDVVVQAHGGGRNSNPFVVELGAAHTIGAATEDAEVLDRWVRYEYYQHEIVRWLEVAGLAGAEATTLDPVVLVTDDERTRVRSLLEGIGHTGSARLMVIHPGATDPRRRWPAERFAEVARERLDEGDFVVVVGDDSDRSAAEEIVARTDGRARSLAGELPIRDLPALLEAADVVVADDSGPRHLAVAVGTPTVGVFWFGNVINAGPFDRARHRIEMSFTTTCPVCGVDVTQVGWSAERCEHDPSFVADVSAEAVLRQVADLLRTAR
jgi:ADP-heptose:LPS heptosyltransferase